MPRHSEIKHLPYSPEQLFDSLAVAAEFRDPAVSGADPLDRRAGFTALLPTMAGAADRCLIPEYAAGVEPAQRGQARTHLGLLQLGRQGGEDDDVHPAVFR